MTELVILLTGESIVVFGLGSYTAATILFRDPFHRVIFAEDLRDRSENYNLVRHIEATSCLPFDNF